MKELYKKNKSIILYFVVYCPIGILCPLIAQYLDSIGFSGTEVGVITSVGTAMAVFGGLFWGRLYANVANKRLIISLMFIGAAVTALISLKITAFIPYAIIYGILYFFQGPSHGLCDTMVITNGEDFPIIRAFGAIGYAAACFVGGKVSQAAGLDKIFYIHAAMFLLGAIIVMTEQEPPHINEKKEKVSALLLLKEKKFLKLLLCSFFVLGCTMANNTYFSYLYIDAGGDLAGVGFCFLLMAGSEAVMMCILPKLLKKIHTEKLLAIGIAVGVIRFFIYSLGPGKGVLIGTFFTQGIMDGIILVEIVKYFVKVVDIKLSDISVSTYYALGTNLSSIVCNLIGGRLIDKVGATGTYLFFAIMIAIGLILYLLFGLYKENEPDHIKQA